MTDSGPVRQCSEAFCQICCFHHFCAACAVFSTPLSVCFCVLSCPWASGFFASYTRRARRPGRAFGQRLMWLMYMRQIPCLEASLTFPCPPWGFAWLVSSISLLPLLSTGFFWEHVLNKLLAHKSLLRVCAQGTQLNIARKAGVKGQSQVWETSSEWRLWRISWPEAPIIWVSSVSPAMRELTERSWGQPDSVVLASGTRLKERIKDKALRCYRNNNY